MGQEEALSSLGALGVTVGEEGIKDAITAALAVGRPSDGGLHPLAALANLMWLWRHGEQIALPLAISTDQARAVLAQAMTGLERPATDGSLTLTVTETGYTVQAFPAMAGLRLDLETAVAQVEAMAAMGMVELHGGGAAPAVELAATVIAPLVTNDVIADVRSRIDRIASMALVFDLGPSGALAARPWLEPSALAGAVRLTGLSGDAYYDVTAARASGRTSVEVDEAEMTRLVGALAARADVAVEEPRVEAVGSRVTVRAGKAGRLVDREAAVRDALGVLRAAAAGRIGTLTTPPTLMDPAPRVVRLQYVSQPPALEGAALAAAAEAANVRLALPLSFKNGDEARVFPALELARMATLSSGLIEPSEARLSARLAEWLPGWIRIDPDLAVREPTMLVRDGRLSVIPGKAGLGFDAGGLAAEAMVRFRSRDAEARSVAVRPRMTAPRRSEADVLSASPDGPVAGQPVWLHSFAGDWQVSTDDLVAAIRYTGRAGELAGTEMAGTLNVDALAERLEPIARAVLSAAEGQGLGDANGGMLRMDVHRTAQAVVVAVGQGAHDAAIEWVRAG
jgi:hypothetical protein